MAGISRRQKVWLAIQGVSALLLWAWLIWLISTGRSDWGAAAPGIVLSIIGTVATWKVGPIKCDP